MSSLNALSSAEALTFFDPEGQHLPLRMARLPQARVVWVNQRVMSQDPAFAMCGSTLDDYRAHLLRSCAFAVTDQLSENEEVAIGVADRYGGIGIGRNGGSGRAVVLNGYHVKGVGRTPLVSVLTEAGHASGGAYLEECVRETIFSELIAAEYPGGAVPTLAIIDTGLVQWWDVDAGPLPERRCLLVRPAFVRPAHFERAAGFIAADPTDGYADARRVDHAFRVAKTLWGRDALSAAYQKLWSTWAEQLAYGFIHRLPHGGDSTSNIAMDGSLLDFGATTATPSWARISLNWGSPPIGEGMFYLVKAVNDHAAMLGRELDPAYLSPEGIRKPIAMAAQVYQRVMLREILRLAGLTRSLAERMVQEEPGVVGILGRLLSHYRREQFAIFDGTPRPRIPWDQGRLWSDDSPSHWRPLRDCLLAWIGKSDSTKCEQAIGYSVFRGQDRPALYHESIKKELYEHLEHRLKGHALCQESLDHLINGVVCLHRRDGIHEPVDAIPVGFARCSTAGYALFQDLEDSRWFAIPEWRAETSAPGIAFDETRLPLREVTEDTIVFDDAAIPSFHGTVSVYATCRLPYVHGELVDR